MVAKAPLALDDTLAVIAAFYDAALDESLWPGALKKLTDLTGSQASSFWVLDGADKSRLPTFISINFDSSVVDEYLGGMARLDPTVRYLLAHPRTAIVHDGMLGEEDDDTRAYLDWHERSVETRFRLVGQVQLEPGLQAGVALHRSPRAGRYTARDIQRFKRLHEHLGRALTLGARIGSLGALRRVSAELLDRSQSAIVLLDLAGRPVFLNRAAEAMDAEHDGIRIDRHGVRLAQKAEDDRLRRLVACAADSLGRSGQSTCLVMRASRLSGRRAYSIGVTAMSRPPAALALFRPALCVVICDPEHRGIPPLDHLQALFKLTPAEARLAARLTAGQSLRDAAGHLGVTYGTARSRLTQLFEKTRTRSQVELVQLLVTVAGCDWHAD